MTPAPADAPGRDAPAPGANSALALLMLINLFNYIDRQVLASVMPRILLDGTLFAADDPDIQFKAGLLTSAFLAAYMVFSPVVGWLDGHGFRRWVILGLGVTVWSLASGGSGFAASYWALFATRCLVGVGEGAYGPVASALLADIYPVRNRGTVTALFNMAIPVGSALGFVIGSQVSDAFDDWRHAFWVTFAGLLLGAWCFTRPEFARPPRVAGEAALSYPQSLALLWRVKSFVLCCAGMTAVTFVIGGLAVWIGPYVQGREARFVLTAKAVGELTDPPKESRRRPLPADLAAKISPLADGAERGLADFKKHLATALTPAELTQALESAVAVALTPGSPSNGFINTAFGAILLVGGLAATAFGAWAGEFLRPRVSGAYFWVIGGGALFALPCYLAILYTPFPAAWGFVFLTIFGLFLHVGPGFTIIANVVPSEVRATAFAVNILVIHALGDVISPPLIGAVADAVSLPFAFLLLSGFIALGGALWLAGVRTLDADTAAAGRA